MMKFKALAVDDELPALDEIAHLLSDLPQIGKIELASDATEAIRKLMDTEPDIVFLDIHMPGLDGIELAKLIHSLSKPPDIVFVTAYEQYAVAAFEVNAADYLLKPVRIERLKQTISRLIQKTQPALPTRMVIPVERRGYTRMVDLEEILVAEAQGDYVRLHLTDDSYLVRMSLSNMEERWATSGFIRVHRKYLINSHHLIELKAEANGSYIVRVGKLDIPVSRRSLQSLKELVVRVEHNGTLP
ncbi:MAG: LytTR family DNA-binding domain-containing protein [Actinobacteria bacterium]|jgi:DNA-binding LytR/AlgR family response regulator|nr:LytTR family DNA-binding domain-containing protein [Actinomycetota bacterium]MCL6095703.1 LytTR family DNA-binding domain-containing protein [Actinomycetota bacterium]